MRIRQCLGFLFVSIVSVCCAVLLDKRDAHAAFVMWWGALSVISLTAAHLLYAFSSLDE